MFHFESKNVKNEKVKKQFKQAKLGENELELGKIILNQAKISKVMQNLS